MSVNVFDEHGNLTDAGEAVIEKAASKSARLVMAEGQQVFINTVELHAAKCEAVRLASEAVRLAAELKRSMEQDAARKQSAIEATAKLASDAMVAANAVVAERKTEADRRKGARALLNLEVAAVVTIATVIGWILNHFWK